ncbi:MAG: CAP domain-containing protein [Campylobacterota bacterium]|nr:CAP domain-containing protein [Campylobacterota bacterium]
MFRVKTFIFSIIVLFFVGCGTDQLVEYAIDKAVDEFKTDDTPDEFITEAEEISKMIERSNEIRAEVFVGSPVSWSLSIALSAQTHADLLAVNGKLEHSQSQYGENLFVSFDVANYSDAVNNWYEEKVFYDYASNSCTGGQACGHYTQLVWEESTEVGCGKATTIDQSATIIVCQYNPPGNYTGESPY